MASRRLNRIKQLIEVYDDHNEDIGTQRITCLLSRVGPGKCCLIVVSQGDRWTEPVCVNDPKAITHSEMLEMTDGCDYEVLADGDWI